MPDIAELVNYMMTPIAQVAIIIGIAEVMKRVGFPKKYIPVVDLVLGIVLGIIVDGLMMEYGIATGFFVGIALGLSACGLFSAGKNILEQFDIEDKENAEETTETEAEDGNSN